MTAITFDAVPQSAIRPSKLQGFLAALAWALDAYAAHRIRNVVPELELRRVDRTIKRYARLIEKSAAQMANAKFRSQVS